MLHTLSPGISNHGLNNFILDPLNPEPIAVHMGYLYTHVDGPIRIRHTIHPAHVVNVAFQKIRLPLLRFSSTWILFFGKIT